MLAVAVEVVTAVMVEAETDPMAAMERIIREAVVVRIRQTLAQQALAVLA